MEMRNVEKKRQQNVKNAMEDLLEKDCKYREELNSQMQNKMRRAESLRKERLENLSRSRSEQMRLRHFSFEYINILYLDLDQLVKE